MDDIKEYYEFGEKIIRAIHTNNDDDVNALINYLDDKSKSYCTEDIREKYAKELRTLIDEIYNSNQETKKVLNDDGVHNYGFGIEIANKRRELLKKLNNYFVYGEFNGRFFYDLFYSYIESKRSGGAVRIERCSPFLEPSDIGINFSIEEDNIDLRNKRRVEDRKKLGQMFSYYIDEYSADGVNDIKQFNDLWDIVDCYIFKYEKISDLVATSALENRRKKTVLNFWMLFGRTGDDGAKYIFKKDMPLDLLNNEMNNKLPIEYDYQKIMSSIIHDVEFALSKKYNRSMCMYSCVINSWYDMFIKIRMMIDNDVWEAVEKRELSILEEKDFRFNKVIFTGGRKENNVMLDFLLCLAKIYILNDLYGLEYVLGDYRQDFKNAHAKIIMEKMSNKEEKAYRGLLNAIKDKYGNNDLLTYDEIKMVLLSSNAIHDKMIEFLPQNANIMDLCRDVEKIFKYIVSPCTEKVALYKFIILMQCCATSADSTLIINHYGMKHGKIKEVKLSTVMRQTKKNRFKEVNVFISHLIRRRQFLNEHFLSREDVDIIDKYILRQYKNIYNFVFEMKSWHELIHYLK